MHDPDYGGIPAFRDRLRVDKKDLRKAVQSLYLQTRTMQRALKDDDLDAVSALLIGAYEDLKKFAGRLSETSDTGRSSEIAK